jgi:hypothetical protein
MIFFHCITFIVRSQRKADAIYFNFASACDLIPCNFLFYTKGQKSLGTYW